MMHSFARKLAQLVARPDAQSKATSLQCFVPFFLRTVDLLHTRVRYIITQKQLEDDQSAIPRRQ